jgi:hypothetical protein
MTSTVRSARNATTRKPATTFARRDHQIAPSSTSRIAPIAMIAT